MRGTKRKLTAKDYERLWNIYNIHSSDRVLKKDKEFCYRAINKYADALEKLASANPTDQETITYVKQCIVISDTLIKLIDGITKVRIKVYNEFCNTVKSMAKAMMQHAHKYESALLVDSIFDQIIY